MRMMAFMSVLLATSSCNFWKKTPVSAPEPSPSSAPEESFRTKNNEEEVKLVQAQPKLFSRTPGVLTLKFANGTKKEFKDSEATPASTVITTLVKYFPAQNSALLLYQLYEGISFQLYSMKTGQAISVFAEPVWSPNGKYFGSGFSDISGQSPEGFMVASLSDGVFKTLYKNEGSTGEVKWESDSRVKAVILKSKADDSVDLVPSGEWICDVSDEKADCKSAATP